MKRLHAEYPTVDLNEFRELCRLEASQSPPFIVAMIKGFLSDGEERMTTIKALVKTKDFVAAGRCAHNLKSAGSYLGVVRLAKLCSQFERCVDDAKLLRDVLQQIEVEFQAVAVELQKYLSPKVRKSLLAPETTQTSKNKSVR